MNKEMKVRRFLTGVVAAMMLAMSFTSCEWFNRPEEVIDLSFTTAVYEDSLRVLDAHATQSLRVDFPADEDTSLVAENVLAWLCEEVSRRSYPDWTNDSTATIVRAEDIEKESPDITFAETYLAYCGQQGTRRMGEELRNYAEDGFFGGFENRLEIRLVEKKDNYMTFNLEHDIYTGGAHGGSYLEGVTFSTNDGSRMDWSIFDQEKRSELIDKMKPGLKTYFSHFETEPVETDSALLECLLLFDDPETPENELEYGVPLPHTAPWLTSDGIAFVYQEYEISAYAYGRPVFVIPVEELEPLMTDHGRVWVRNALKTKEE